ncbi:hypothetical protein GE115_12465 [Agromyces sp. CFH 90414]|uniref:Uncharacterized protein n=1 Tax=Agromyces agglutinans TaxID=2662258 RepID=A0A6I2F5F4_9MICO|nr:hypothetical protein [Agromyces agglutinans]MRG60675.1 hypothetical protein [Agromyces agglutinans]
MQVLTDPVAVWFAPSGAPVRIFWRGRRWRVSDTATPLSAEPEFVPGTITHPPANCVGWRFQVTDANGETHVVDLVGADASWTVTRAYE